MVTDRCYRRPIVVVAGVTVALAAVLAVAALVRTGPRSSGGRVGDEGGSVAVHEAEQTDAGRGRDDQPASDEQRASDCLVDLHNICISALMYEADSGEYPPSLGALAQDGGELEPRYLVAVGDPGPEPVGRGGLRTSYRYVGELPKGTPRSVIIAYSRKGLLRGGRCVAYLDCEVEFVLEEALHRERPGGRLSLQQSYLRVKEDAGHLTADRDAELRSFYEVE